jgi:hypothetical protein
MGTETTDNSVKATMPTGWVCPKCGRVNAPWVAACDCKAQIVFVPQPYPVYMPRPYYPVNPDPYFVPPVSPYIITWQITNQTNTAGEPQPH